MQHTEQTNFCTCGIVKSQMAWIQKLDKLWKHMGNIRKKVYQYYGVSREWNGFFLSFSLFLWCSKTTNILLAKQFKGQWYRSLNNFCKQINYGNLESEHCRYTKFIILIVVESFENFFVFITFITMNSSIHTIPSCEGT